MHLDLGGSNALLVCEVLAFLGPMLVLRPVERLTGRLEARISQDATGYLLLDAAGPRKALACSVAVVDERTLAVRMRDSFRLGQHRRWSRIALECEATLQQIGSDAPARTTRTIDVSPGGARLQRPEGMPLWPRFALTLSGAPLGDAPMTLEAVPARTSPHVLGVRFSVVAEADERRLIEILLRTTAAQPAPVRQDPAFQAAVGTAGPADLSRGTGCGKRPKGRPALSAR